MATLPQLKTEVRLVPDWPGYAIDQCGNMWQYIRDNWARMHPRRTAAGPGSVWLHLEGGAGNATRRVSDIYMEVFNDEIPQRPGGRPVSNRGR